MKIGLALDVWYRAPGDYRYKLTEDLQNGDACLMTLNPPKTWRLVQPKFAVIQRYFYCMKYRPESHDQIVSDGLPD